LVENPVIATTTPIIATPSNAMNFMNMNISPILVPSFVDMQFNNVTANKPPRATLLLTQPLTSSASAPTAALTKYSPNMIEIMAVPPGFKTITAHHMNRKPVSSPKIFDR
jgi:hypothetical protein